MKFLSDILAKAGLTVDGVVTLNNTATGQTPAANDNSTKLATTAWVRTFVQPYSLPIASASVLGGIKVGSGLSIDSGTGILSVTGGGAASIKSTQTFIATAGQTVFTITGGYTPTLIDVFLNGVYLSPNQTTATNGTTVTLGDAALAGDIIDVIVASPIYEGATTTTDQLPEGVVNLYYTNARARAAISLTVTGTYGASTYNSSTGVLNVPTYTLAGLGGVVSTRTITINGVTYDLTANRTWSALPTGGTAGQLLAKVDGTDYNAQWINEAPAASYTSQIKHAVKAGQAISKGQAVYVSSSDGTNMIVSKASNAIEMMSSKTMGLLESSVSTNGFTNVITEGLLAGLNTNGANAGDPVWLGTDGNLIYGLLNKPSAPAHLVFIGVVTRANANNGEIFVKVQNGFEMGELHDYVQNGVQDNYVISYESSTSLYKPKSIATLLGYTPANAARNLTINGTTYDLTADRTWTLTTSVVAEGTNLYYTQGRFDTAFAAKSTTNLSEGTNLYYTDARVGTYLTNNSYATQTYVNTAVSNLVDAAPGTLDTLNELAAALGDDPNFATTVATSIGTKEPIITAGTTSQYWRGDKTWQTLPIYTLSGLGGVPTTRSLTINGTAYDLSADRSWTINSMVYPGAGIPVSTGTAWGTSITNNSANWNTAYGWGNHASAGYLTGITSSQVTTALGFTPYNSTNPSGYITSSALSSYLPLTYTATQTLRFDNTSSEHTTFQNQTSGAFIQIGFQQTDSDGLHHRAYIKAYKSSAGNYSGVIDIIARSVGGGTTVDVLRLEAGQSPKWSGNVMWHAGNLTNLNQLTNGPGYITSYTETDTLATVVARGSSTGGGRPITLDNGGGAILVRASTGGWSMGTYYQGSSGTTLAGFGAYGGNNSLTWAWVGPGYESPWLTLNGSAVNSQVALQQGGNQVWHAGNLKVNYYQEDTSTLIPIGPYDKFVWGTGDRAAALIINDTAGARYAITAGSYDLSFYKHNSSAGTAVRAFYIDGNSTAGINNVTFETAIVSTNLTINRDLGTNDYSAIGQHNMQLRIRKASLDGGCAPRTLELGVLDNGTGIIQANHCGVGYNTLALNPVAGGVTVNGSTVWTQGNLTNLNQLTNGPGYITGESDTLASVTGRGASTSTAVTFSGGLNVASSKVGFRNAGLTEFIQGEAWTMGIYGYNSNDGFLFYQRDTSDVARPCFHIGGWNNAAYGGYSNADSMITLVRGDGTKSEGSTYATRGLSSSSYYSNIIKTTGGTVFRDSQSSHSFTGSVVVNGTGIYTAGDGGAGSQATVVAIRVRGLGGYDSLEIGTENNYDGVIRSYGNDLRYYSGHWRTVGSTSSENHSHYWYTSKAGSTNWSNHKMRLDHDGILTVASHVSTTGNLHTVRGRVAFSNTAGDANHCIYNNYNNIDSEGSFDGMKMNVYAGLHVRTGNAGGAVPTLALDVNSTRTKVGAGQLWCGEANSRNGGVALVLNDGAIHVRADGDYYHKIWYYDGIAFGTNYAHGHFRFYAETATQRNNGTGGATLVFDINSVNGNAWASGDITAYSDARVKTDIKVIQNSIEKIQAIRGVTFLRTDAQEQDKEKRHAGVIAQEVLEVLPEVVTENNEGMYSVAYGNLVALLIEGIKEQQVQIESQKIEIEELKDLVKQLINR